MEHSLETCTRCEQQPAVIEHPDGPWCGACALAAFATRFDDEDAMAVLPLLKDRLAELDPESDHEDAPAAPRLSR